MEYISLGHNCSSVTHHIKNNLMKSKIQGRKTCPFDLMVSTYTGVCNMIENNFENFLDVEAIDNPNNPKYNNPTHTLFYSDGAKKTYNNGMVCSKENGLLFNHESPGHPFLAQTERWGSIDKFTRNNYKEFNTRYNNRIQNFNQYITNALNNDTMIIFLLNTYVTPHTLCNIIKLKYPTLKFKIFCNKIDDSTLKHIQNFENDVCNYTPINEESYNNTFINEHIIMDGWEKMDLIIPTLL